jgi:adenylate cyclase
LVRQHLSIKQISPSLQQFIHERGEGHPLFTLALANTMQQVKLLRIANGEAQLLMHARQPGMLPLPPIVQKAVTYTLDRLPPPYQLLLKRASALGESFSGATLQATYPATADATQLAEQLQELVNWGLLQPIDGSSQTYRFAHNLGREVIYNLLVSEQQQSLPRPL